MVAAFIWHGVPDCCIYTFRRRFWGGKYLSCQLDEGQRANPPVFSLLLISSDFPRCLYAWVSFGEGGRTNNTWEMGGMEGKAGYVILYPGHI
jgi:hypothetical protein